MLEDLCNKRRSINVIDFYKNLLATRALSRVIRVIILRRQIKAMILIAVSVATRYRPIL